MNYLSYGKIKSFVECPFRYKWIYIDKKEYQYGQDYDESKFINTILEEYHFYIVRNNGIKFDQRIDQIWEYFSAVLPESSYDRTKRIMVDYMVKYINPKNIMTTSFFPQIYLNKSTRLNGRFDRVDKYNSGQGVRLFDFRLGKHFVCDKLWNMIYGYMLRKAFPSYKYYQIERCHLEKDISINLLMPDQDDAEKYIMNHVDVILNAKEFPCKKNDFCNQCYIKKTNQCKEVIT
jgi:hypothetical protein